MYKVRGNSSGVSATVVPEENICQAPTTGPTFRYLPRLQADLVLTHSAQLGLVLI